MEKEAGAGAGAGMVESSGQAMDIDSYGDDNEGYGNRGHDP